MSDTQNDTILAALRTRQRDLELDACAVRARVEEVAELIAMLEHRRRPGRPRKDKADADLMQLCPDGIIRPVEAGTSALNPYPSQGAGTSALNPYPSQGELQQALNIVPQRVEGGAHEPETTETAA